MDSAKQNVNNIVKIWIFTDCSIRVETALLDYSDLDTKLELIYTFQALQCRICHNFYAFHACSYKVCI